MDHSKSTVDYSIWDIERGDARLAVAQQRSYGAGGEGGHRPAADAQSQRPLDTS